MGLACFCLIAAVAVFDGFDLTISEFVGAVLGAVVVGGCLGAAAAKG